MTPPPHNNNKTIATKKKNWDPKKKMGADNKLEPILILAK